MSFSKAASICNASDDFCCPRCSAPLLPEAVFCSSCGERIDIRKASSLLQNESDISDTYHITSLVRRRPFVNLYFALDNQQCMVVIRDIDITSLNDEARMQAVKLFHQEHASLRLWQNPYVLPVIDVRYFKGHLYTIFGYPLATSSVSSTGNSGNAKALTGNVRRFYTLQDFLQSGQGLPSEQQALKWIQNLCQALDALHQHQIIAGELDPYTIMLDENSDHARPALMISWLSPQLQKLLRSSETSTRFWSYFSAPEALQGKAEPRSDIFSLGAVLYLLLSGSLPSEKGLRSKGRLRSPHELNSGVSAYVSDCVMRALDAEPSKRFQNVSQMSEALFNPRYSRLQTRKLNNSVVAGTSPPEMPGDDAETKHIDPLSQDHLDQGQSSRPQTTSSNQIPHRPIISQPVSQPEETVENQSEEQQQSATALEESLVIAAAPAEAGDEKESVSTLSSPGAVESPNIPSQNESTIPWFKRLQRLILSQQQHPMIAAAMIESPVCVQPDQIFMLRIHVMGRDKPSTWLDVKEPDCTPGLSRLISGDTFSIEVCAMLHQNYTFVVQQTTNTIPAAGFISEITIPIKLLTNMPGAMRERLLISFLDKQLQPLYEKPSIVEVFVSQHVKRGHEGHHVLAIPQ